MPQTIGAKASKRYILGPGQRAIDQHVQAEQVGDEDDDGQVGALAPVG